MNRRPDPPESPPTLPRVSRPSGGSGAPTPAPGAEVTAAAAVAAALPWAGSLAEEGPLRLWYLVAAAQATGRLVLETPDVRYALHFRRGTPEHAVSSDPADDLGRFLVARGTIAAERLADAEQAKARFGGDLVTALTALGVMNPAESFRVLQEHGTLVVQRALALERGTARWEPNAPLPPSAFPLGHKFGLLCEAVRRLDGLAVRRLLGARMQRAAVRTGGRVEASELKLTALEARAASFFDGVRSPAELAAAHPAEANALAIATLLYAETELLAFGAERAAPPPAAPPPPAPATSAPGAAAPAPSRPAAPAPAAPPRPAPAQPPAPAPAPKAAAPAPAPRPAPPPPSLASLKATLARVKKADHWDALGVTRNATTAQVKAAYFQLAKQYHPDAMQPGEPPEAKELRADVFARISEAWGVLGDEARKQKYVEELASGGAASVDIAAIMESEELFTRATVLLKARQYAGAIEALDRALQLQTEPEFSVWRAWAGFLASEDKRVARLDAEKQIDAALAVNPRCVPAFLFLGQMAKLTGDVAAAERHLKRGLAVDPEHPELQRELKYLRK